MEKKHFVPSSLKGITECNTAEVKALLLSNSDYQKTNGSFTEMHLKDIKYTPFTLSINCHSVQVMRLTTKKN